MIRWILAQFGYIKIPPEAVDLSKAQDIVIRKLIDRAFPNIPEKANPMQKYIEGQEVLTRFLQSGKWINLESVYPPTEAKL